MCIAALWREEERRGEERRSFYLYTLSPQTDVIIHYQISQLSNPFKRADKNNQTEKQTKKKASVFGFIENARKNNIIKVCKCLDGKLFIHLVQSIKIGSTRILMQKCSKCTSSTLMGLSFIKANNTFTSKLQICSDSETMVLLQLMIHCKLNTIFAWYLVVFTLVVLQHLMGSDVPHLNRVVSTGSSNASSTGMEVHMVCITWEKENMQFNDMRHLIKYLYFSKLIIPANPNVGLNLILSYIQETTT